jgi:hypothetical protein
MLTKLLGVVLVTIGTILAFGAAGVLILGVIGAFWLLVKLAIPLAILYIGYRLLTRDRDCGIRQQTAGP